jgi:hypothetical protein
MAGAPPLGLGELALRVRPEVHWGRDPSGPRTRVRGVNHRRARSVQHVVGRRVASADPAPATKKQTGYGTERLPRGRQHGSTHWRRKLGHRRLSW